MSTQPTANDPREANDHPTISELEAGLDHIRASPADAGPVEMLTCRPRPGERAVVESARLEPDEGFVGDNWRARGSRRTEDGSAHPGMQLTLMNTRVVAAVARSRARWALAGDQIYVDLDLSAKNVPPGTRLSIGTATVEVSEVPHTGCKKFVQRFGVDAMKFVNSATGRGLSLRGINAIVIEAGEVSVGDRVRKIASPGSPA